MRSGVARGLAAGVVAFVAALGVVVAVPASAEGELAVIELNPGDVFQQTFESINVSDGGTFITPADCVGDVPSCDVIRLKLNRDTSEGAVNFIRIELRWEGGAQPPDLALVVAGLGLGPVNDLDMYIYDAAGTRIEGTGGATAGDHEVGAILADQDVYDLVINQFTGTTLEYELSIIFSNELFESPFEALDPSLRDSSASNGAVDRSGDVVPPPAASVAPSVGPSELSSPAPVGSLAPITDAVATVRDVEADSDFAGFRGTVDDQLAAPSPLQASRTSVLADAPAPGTALVLFWLVLAPTLIALAFFLYLRRRRPAALSI